MPRWIARVGIVGLVCLAAGAVAQETTRSAGSEWTIAVPGDPAVTDKESSLAGRFDNLSAEDQKIAKAIFFSQRATAMGPPVWSLNRIATAHRDGRDWVQICEDLHDLGLVAHRELSQVIGTYNRRQPAVYPSSSRAIVTTGTGRSIVFGGGTSGGIDDILDGTANNAGRRNAGSGSFDGNGAAPFSHLAGFHGGDGIVYGAAGEGAGAMFTIGDGDRPETANPSRLDRSIK